MREIKFRAWLKELNVFVPMSHTTMNHWYEFPEDVIMCQYTGLKDKNGVEIYEGDVLLHHHRHWDWQQKPVEWLTFLEDREGSGIIGYDLDPECVKDAEVIGNIYENPELVGK